jgi:hypothetical protein
MLCNKSFADRLCEAKGKAKAQAKPQSQADFGCKWLCKKIQEMKQARGGQ